MTTLVLASASPRRAELLSQIGVQYTVSSADIDESVLAGESPSEYVGRLAQEKARAILSKFGDSVVIAADTSVVLGDTILGKPENTDHACEILQSLSGCSHIVYSGVAVCRMLNNEIEMFSDVVKTQVNFLPFDESLIQRYVATEEPMDKAGAYGIQGKGAIFVDSIQGSYSNVVGLPLAQTAQLLSKCNVPIWQD
mgnify:CR=1 FL=1